MVLSDPVLARSSDPRNSGEFAEATHSGVAGHPGEGPFVQVWLQVHSSQIVQGSFSCNGCLAAVACCSAVLDLATLRTVAVAARIEPSDVRTLLQELPEGKGHYADLAVAALHDALNHRVNS